MFHHGPRQISILCHLPDTPCLSLVTTFKLPLEYEGSPAAQQPLRGPLQLPAEAGGRAYTRVSFIFICSFKKKTFP